MDDGNMDANGVMTEYKKLAKSLLGAVCYANSVK